MSISHLRSVQKLLPKLFHLLLLIAFLVLIPVHKTSAQWSMDGVQMIADGASAADSCPDGMGGAWLAQTVIPDLSEIHVIVQHIDSEGYLAFSVDDGLDVAPTRNSYLCGIEPGPNGDCIVMYEDDFNLYAQRVTQQGELLWGDEGVNISPRDLYLKMPLSWDFGSSTESDDAGGLWGFWVSSTISYTNIYLCGVNADGTLKLEEDLNLGLGITAYNTHQSVQFTKDGEGGVVVMKGDYADGWETPRHIYVERILANGTLLYGEWQLVMDWPEDELGQYTHPFHIKRDPQGGYVVTSSALWQRISDDLEPEWDMHGALPFNWDPPPYGLQYKSTPVILSDRSVLCLATVYDLNSAYLGQVDLDGTRRNGDDWGPYAGDSTYHPALPGPDLPAPDRNSMISAFRARPIIDPYSEIPKLNMQRLSPTGENLWARLLKFGDGETYTPSVAERLAFYLDDESICYFMGGNAHNDNTFYSYKVYVADGSVAGDTTSVSEPGGDPPALPDSPALITNVYPNPFNNAFTVEVDVNEPGAYELKIQNILGQTVDRVHFECRQSGKLDQVLSLPDSSTSGIYFVSLVDKASVHSRNKIIYLQ